MDKFLPTQSFKQFIQEQLNTQPPAWWNEPSDNPFTRKMTKGNEILDWLTRYGLTPNKDGRYKFYHATPINSDIKKLGYIRKGSYLAINPDKAKFFAARDRDLKPNQIILYDVYLFPWEFSPGIHPTLIFDYPIKTTIKKGKHNETIYNEQIK